MEKLDELKQTIALTWKNVLSTNKAAQLVASGEFDVRFFKIYLLETYHYTLHNARNQALVGARLDNTNTHYMKYCLKHAYEEVGHELMALHDLRQLGVEEAVSSFPAPLPETQILIAYLYYVSQHGNPLRRLGYSAWAEDSYEQFGPFLQKLQSQLNLKRSQMSFFVEHATVDDKHSDEVFKAIASGCKTDQDWADVSEVAVTSLQLASNLLEAVAREYKDLALNKSSRYAFLRD